MLTIKLKTIEIDSLKVAAAQQSPVQQMQATSSAGQPIERIFAYNMLPGSSAAVCCCST
jgi:hypothetical protein